VADAGDVSNARLPLSKVVAVALAVVGVAAPAAVARDHITRLEVRADASDARAAAAEAEGRAAREAITKELSVLDKRQTLQEERYTNILSAMQRVEATLKERTVYARGRGEQ
jgi:hypothetical protein